MKDARFVVREFNKKFPNIKGVEVQDKNRIFLGNIAEGGEVNDVPAADYYGYDLDPQEQIWILGIHKDVVSFLEKRGWFAEWYDPGTVYAYPI